MSRQRTLAVELSAGLPSNISTSETLAVGVFTDEPRAPGAAALGERLGGGSAVGIRGDCVEQCRRDTRDRRRPAGQHRAGATERAQSGVSVDESNDTSRCEKAAL